MGGLVKQEIADYLGWEEKYDPTPGILPLPESAVVDNASSADESYGGNSKKRSRVDENVHRQLQRGIAKVPKLETSSHVELPPGFLDPLPLTLDADPISVGMPRTMDDDRPSAAVKSCKQFWKAGDYEGDNAGRGSTSSPSGMDHLRVHPRFLHSNATSHKWALGAFAELLDNSLDEVCNGATFVSVDVLRNNKQDGSRMLAVQDNGGGMAPDILRQCMSLGFSAKSKMANTVGQYGNGFKTSTMRLGADAVVFTRCNRGKGSSPSTQSVGMLSYTFLRSTGKEDIVVPIIDYERRGPRWSMLAKSSSDVWTGNLETILQWSPYASEEDLLHQFSTMGDQGTRIIIYNLWEDDQGDLELDFDSDPHDIQLRGACRDEKKIAMAQKYPNSRHFLTYQHSLRTYASILYLRIPPGFRIILRGKDIDHHSLVDDMMHTTEHIYRPQSVAADRAPKDPNIAAVVTLGFAKDAVDHIDIQGFSVYHKNRLIKPFWRVWNAAGSNGRGVIGVLEPNFVEPAHDKQGFERTTVLSRLEARLIDYQKRYWALNRDKIGYVSQRNSKSDKECPNSKPSASKNRSCSQSNSNKESHFHHKFASNSAVKCEQSSLPTVAAPCEPENITSNNCPPISWNHRKTRSSIDTTTCSSNAVAIIRILKRQQCELMQQVQCERERRQKLEGKLLESENRVKELNNETELLIDVFSEERERRDEEVNKLNSTLKEASHTIDELLSKLRSLEKS